ncbi:hypothetical protein ACG9YX_12595 [Acinetobacter nematophilus]|uniref:hypothetical protein n=1 Tax=Acinetobacter nematophilus TaxID=2994642 RepID=UPI003AF978BE
MKLLLLLIPALFASCASYDLNGESTKASNCRVGAGGYYESTSNMSSYDKAMYGSCNGYSSLKDILRSEDYTCLNSARVK